MRSPHAAFRLAHGEPHVGVRRSRRRDGLARTFGDGDSSLRVLRQLAGDSLHLRRRLQGARGADTNVIPSNAPTTRIEFAVLFASVAT